MDLTQTLTPCAAVLGTMIACAPAPGGFDFDTDAAPPGASESDQDGGTPASDEADGADSTGVDPQEKFDVGAGAEGAGDEGSGECLCGDAGLLFSYIWIANSAQGTVSKLDTQTMEEVGRYVTRPDGEGNPSRTSVTIDGRAVAVANRHGGVTKIWARTEDCVESNGTPGIQTSTGADDVLPWGQDECVAWYTAFPEFTTQRPVAWTAGTLNPATCRYEHPKLWTSGCGGGDYPGFGGAGGIDVHRLDGDTGVIEASVAIPEAACSPVGAYGGGVDAEGDFWFNRVGEGAKMLGVVHQDMSYELHDLPPGIYAYGMTIDSMGRPWVSGVHAGKVAARFDPLTLGWTLANAPLLRSEGGMQQDGQGRMWVAANGDDQGTSVVALDGETLAVVESVALPGGMVKGVSVDVDGYVWAVTSETAYRVTPDGGGYEAYDGLVSPYTYSDMTGWGLFQAECPTPAG